MDSRGVHCLASVRHDLVWRLKATTVPAFGLHGSCSTHLKGRPFAAQHGHGGQRKSAVCPPAAAAVEKARRSASKRSCLGWEGTSGRASKQRPGTERCAPGAGQQTPSGLAAPFTHPLHALREKPCQVASGEPDSKRSRATQ